MKLDRYFFLVAGAVALLFSLLTVPLLFLGLLSDVSSESGTWIGILTRSIWGWGLRLTVDMPAPEIVVEASVCAINFVIFYLIFVIVYVLVAWTRTCFKR